MAFIKLLLISTIILLVNSKQTPNSYGLEHELLKTAPKALKEMFFEKSFDVVDNKPKDGLITREEFTSYNFEFQRPFKNFVEKVMKQAIENEDRQRFIGEYSGFSFKDYRYEAIQELKTAMKVEATEN